ncbi:hypothetical protein ABZP36_018373 [Zizania latifolia]
MEQLQHLLASGSKASTTIPFYLALDHTSSSPPVVPPPAPPALDPPKQSSHGSSGSEAIKAKIISHPLYPSLLRAFVDCRKIGAPLDVAGRLSSITDELSSDDRPDEGQPVDPELDQFMETYCYMLARYGQELARPIQEADDLFRSMEAQIDSLSLDDNSREGGGSSEDEQEAVGMATAAGSPENAELKSYILNKYSGYLSSLWRELSKKNKKKGHLPRDARDTLLQWWHRHYRWPYPSEMEKAALAETTGLDTRQISNWFINQRKRHWKPTPPAADVDYYRSSLQLQYPQFGASSSSSAAALWMEGGSRQHYFAGGSAYLGGRP